MCFPVNGLMTFNMRFSSCIDDVGQDSLTNLLGVKVLFAICVLLEQLARTMAKELVVCNLKLESF